MGRIEDRVQDYWGGGAKNYGKNRKEKTRHKRRDSLAERDSYYWDSKGGGMSGLNKSRSLQYFIFWTVHVIWPHAAPAHPYYDKSVSFSYY